MQPRGSALPDFVLRQFDRGHPEFDHRQLYLILQSGMRESVLPAGTRLPPSRTLAQALGITTETIPAREFADRTAFDAALAAALDQHGADFIALAGFMRILGAGFVGRYRGRLINIHPSLLPQHKGLHTHAQVLAAGDASHGASVHFDGTPAQPLPP